MSDTTKLRALALLGLACATVAITAGCGADEKSNDNDGAGGAASSSSSSSSSSTSGSGGTGGAGGAGGEGGAGGGEPSAVGHPQRFLFGDEHNSRILYIDVNDPTQNWEVAIPGGMRDMQLVGGNRLLVGTNSDDGGFREVDLATHQIVKSVDHLGLVRSVQRLANGNTVVSGANIDGSGGNLAVVEYDTDGHVVKHYPTPTLNGGDSRLLRFTASGTYLVGSGPTMYEFDSAGNVLWSADVHGEPAYEGLRLPNGDTLVTNGHPSQLMVFGPGQNRPKLTFNGVDPEVLPYYYGQFQILPNKHIVMTNWRGHGPDPGGKALVEFDENGNSVWSWIPTDGQIVASHAVIVLDGLDPQKLYDERAGEMKPVN